MTSVRVLDLEGAMATSVAITADVLDTANRLALRSGQADQFDVQPWSPTTMETPRNRWISWSSLASG